VPADTDQLKVTLASPVIEAVNVAGEPWSTSDGQLTATVGQTRFGTQPVHSATVTVVELGTVWQQPSATSTLAV
jgi:hypothetical protein